MKLAGRVTRIALILVVGCVVELGLLLGGPISPAGAVIESATSDGLTAQVSYTSGGPYGVKNVRITIIRNGVVLLDEAPEPICNYCSVVPENFGQHSPAHAVQLDSSPDPEAVFDFFTGGAHCCTYSLIYRYDAATNAYIPLEHDWFNAGYRFIDPENDGIPEFLTRDDRFAYKYAAYAFSQYPPQVWRYDSGQMVDVTRLYPAIVTQKAAGEHRKYRRIKGRGDIRAILAAYVADQCLLGDCASGFNLVRSAKRHGYLHKAELGFGPTGAKFIHRLRTFLVRLGYL